MNIQTEKLKLIEWITRIQDKSLLEHLLIIRNEHSKSSDWWNEISEYEKSEIEAGLNDVSEGRTIDHSEVKKSYEKWSSLCPF